MAFQFAYATARNVVFGAGVIKSVPKLLGNQDTRILLVTGKNTRRAEELAQDFTPGVSIHYFSVEGEPTTDDILEGTTLVRKIRTEAVLALGGGSVIDAGKAIAALATNPGELFDYLEVIGRGKALSKPSLRCIALPTTAGTGAEVTKNSVIKSPGHKVKVSLRSDFMYPDTAIVDPELTYSMPPGLTASTGVDALTHLMETFVSNQANPFNDMICREGIGRISRSLLKAYKNGNDAEARSDMSMASLLGGMALANVKLGAIHGFAGPMGGMYPIPHGTVCASLMAAVVETNIEALKAVGADLAKYDELARIVTGNKRAKARDAVTWAAELVEALNIPPLAEFGLAKADFPELVKKAKAASSMKGNPIVLSDDHLTAILEKSL